MIFDAIKDVFEEATIKKIITDIVEKIGNGNLNLKNEKDLEAVTRIFDVIEYAPKKFLDYINRNDNILDSFIAYRIPKAIVGSVFNILFELDNVAIVANQDVGREDLKLEPVTQKVDHEHKESNPRCLVFSKPDERIFRFIKGMEFDLNGQIRFMKLFNTACEMLSADKKDDEGKDETKIKNDLRNCLINFFPDESLMDKIVEKLIALNSIKNKLADQGLKKLAGENVGKNLKKYSYVEYEIKTTVSLFNIRKGENKKFVNKEVLRCWYNFNPEYVPQNGEFTICESWEPEYEHRTIEDAGVINIEGSHLVTIEVELSRTTGIQELVKKGIVQLQEEKLLQKAAGAQWGAAGAEAGAAADKLLVTFLKARYESDPVLPNKNLKFLLYDDTLNNDISQSYRNKYPINQPFNFSALDIKINLPLNDVTNHVIDGISSALTSKTPTLLDFIKIRELK